LRRPDAVRRPQSFAWLDVVVAILAAGGITASTLYAVQFRRSDYAASDFKTLYASIWCFAHGISAYSIPNLKAVFIANGVIQPPRWYGHAPVYPWTTLALGSPVAMLGMVAACYAATILSGALMAAAIFALMHYAARRFGLGPVWRIAIAGLCAGGPLVAFGMDMGNVSLPASALCFIAFAGRSAGGLRTKSVRRWIPAVALAIAFLLKPHVALWVGLGMALLPERAGRAVAAKALALVVGFTAVTAAAMAATGTLTMQTHAYLAMLKEETGSGASMSAASREALPVVSQITSLDSIIGFWTSSAAVRVGLTFALLLVLALVLWRMARRVHTERGALLAVCAWCALGTLATYHRAHDAVVLLLLTPWLVDRVRRAPRAWHAWAATALYCAISISADFPSVQRWVSGVSAHSVMAFILLRQAGIADLLLLTVAGFALAQENGIRAARQARTAEAEDVAAAA
jgi:hypothetical protein